MCLGGEAVGLLSGGSPVRILWGLLRAHRFPMHVYAYYFVCKFSEFEWISGKNEAKTYRKCVKKSLLFLFGGGKI